MLVLEEKEEELIQLKRDHDQELRMQEEQSHMIQEWFALEKNQLQELSDVLMAEKEELKRDVSVLRQTASDSDAEKADLSRKLALMKQELQQKDEDAQRRAADFQARINDLERRLADERREKLEMQLRSSDQQERLSAEREEMTRRMEIFEAECQKRLKQEEAEAADRMESMRLGFERDAAEEKTAAEARLAQTRRLTEQQLRLEREVSESVRHILRELPPLQAAMELGNSAALDSELTKWQGELLSDRFGDSHAVVQAVVNLARERLMTWRGVEHSWKDTLREAEHGSGGLNLLTQQCQKIFRVIKEAQLTKLNLKLTDPEAMNQTLKVFLTWQERSMICNNSVQRLIIVKILSCSQLGPFDFADLDGCLRRVDREESGSHEVFLSRARAVVEDETTAPKDLKGLLSHIETMLFFLKYAKLEDLQKTHQEFKCQSAQLHPIVADCLGRAEQVYAPGRDLVRLADDKSLTDNSNIEQVLQDLRKPSHGQDTLNVFREIFYQWALAMRKQFNLLVLPHHTQVVTLLAFQRFLEASTVPGGVGSTVHALIAQVGTGEGKSMIIAALAIYVVVALRKKVHVVVDDETLLERDFGLFRKLFESFEVNEAGGTTPLRAVLCVSEERITKGDSSLVKRVDAEAHICYCEAKHVLSFYSSIARSEKPDFDRYSEYVLLLDEVDALVIDEEPNDAFVYPNEELSSLATCVAEAMQQGIPAESAVTNVDHPAGRRVLLEVKQEWAKGKNFVEGQDYVFLKETGRYCALQTGRANPNAWSLALECRNFQDKLSNHILFKERLFVMSKPRVFKRYHRILGLSGSIGSKPERDLLQSTYKASFFEVPPFLKTCKGSPFHEPVPAPFGQQRSAIYVEDTIEVQTKRIAEIASQAHQKVPVLVIARDRTHVDLLVDSLQRALGDHARGASSEDICLVRSLSRTLYESNPEQWKDNLSRATMPIRSHEGLGKIWRVTVTDRRGGRGTDYRVDDEEVNDAGGLLLIPTFVPESRREWTQFLGRTARQDRRGQYCAVLCSADYPTHVREQISNGRLGLNAVEFILSSGDKDVAQRIQASAALYNSGVRVNELCEDILARRRELLLQPAARELLVESCQRVRWMSVAEIDGAFGRLPGFDPQQIPTEAADLGRPEAPANGYSQSLGVGRSFAAPVAPKVIIFCLDWSCSMKSRDTRGPLNRFETCVRAIQGILSEQVKDADLVGIVCFGPTVQTIMAPSPKGTAGKSLSLRLASLKPQEAGGTCFFDAVLKCLNMLSQRGIAPPGASRWLVCLTDGDDLGSSRGNTRGELVSRALLSGSFAAELNMIMITVGSLKLENVHVIQSWVNHISSAGGKGLHLGDKDASGISKAFDVVAEYLAGEVGGATEC